METPVHIRNKTYYDEIKIKQTPNRGFERNLYVDKLLNCKPADIKKILFGNKESRPFRKLIEHSTAAKQCMDTIGKVCIPNNMLQKYNFIPDSNTTHCWLCGFPFSCENKIECEHLVPITFAGLFTGIKIKNKEKDEEFKQAFIDAYTNNYLYAHLQCNRTKSDLMLLKWDNTGVGAMVFDEKNGLELQKRILSVNNVPQIESVRDNIRYKAQMMDNFKNKMAIITKFINDEYNVFLSEGMSMTDYVKYIIKMTELYFSKVTLEKMETSEEIRNNLTEVIGKTEEEIEDESKEISNEIFDIMEDNVKHTTVKKPNNFIKNSDELDSVKEVLFQSESNDDNTDTNNQSNNNTNNILPTNITQNRKRKLSEKYSNYNGGIMTRSMAKKNMNNNSSFNNITQNKKKKLSETHNNSNGRMPTRSMAKK